MGGQDPSKGRLDKSGSGNFLIKKKKSQSILDFLYVSLWYGNSPAPNLKFTQIIQKHEVLSEKEKTLLDED